jgi:hypothetical protein
MVAPSSCLWSGFLAFGMRPPQERNHFEIFEDGAYIHWPDLDEDLTAAGLLAARKSGESAVSLQKWLAFRMLTRKRRASRRPSIPQLL